MSDLTTDQRWLLYFIGGWMIRDCLIDSAGTDHLMQSMAGGYNHKPPTGGPEWMTAYETRNGKVVSPGHGDVRVVVTKAQINAYARSLSTSIRDELIAARDEETTERNRTLGWCHCPHAHIAPNAHSGPCTRYHPTEDEDHAHYLEADRLRGITEDILRRALRLNEQAEQLDLFTL
ncbi:Uncharacterised protein [Mycobacteroides abscessus]|uniref:Uncharacterized protein n=1 Tax=Mycolicibacterium llatzerense TaxID=280871 RepID=A0A0D1JMB1_9MYCO|nr:MULTISPECIES: hypothetical protein [Mycobacteriaceae]KIU13639.1 hypothetical protein TL10_28775 [Mycolicibacterium llatzerense]MCT7372575.1 hypothetical protein [Mycolicibacterium llatzerense]WGI35820.1 hypothetical protein QDT91_28185 [Mycolicibacterium aubagnense]CPT78087.1 Uncharacterised protein [Mycobacteroides abscessus]CPU63237.1 Uncharacterised protein [Mycobacteroides abscessus]